MTGGSVGGGTTFVAGGGGGEGCTRDQYQELFPPRVLAMLGLGEDMERFSSSGNLLWGKGNEMI